MAPSQRLIAPLVFLLTGTLLPALDLNSDGLEDIWQTRYHANSLAPGEDADNDGRTNLQESLAGTDPFDPTSFFTTQIDLTSGTRIQIPSQPGKTYQLYSSTTLGDPWTPVGIATLALGSTLELPAPAAGTTAFYRVEVRDTDTDNDGVNDWSELQLAGFDRQNGDSFASGSANNDLVTATAMVQAILNNQVTLAVATASSSEKEQTPAVVTFTRGSTVPYPTTLFFRTRATTETGRASARKSEYTLRDGTNQPTTYRVVIPANTTSAELRLQGTADTLAEVPEHVILGLNGTAQTADLTVIDAANTPANQKLLVAYLHPPDGVTTSASGIATIRLQGDNDRAIVTVSFSNLNSAVNSTQIFSDSSTLQSIAATNYGGHNWTIRATQNFPSDQDLLDKILTGATKLIVFTQTQVNGEVEGFFQPTTGSTEFQIPENPTPAPILTGSDLDRDIIRFLTQATFGPTPESIADLQTRVANNGGNQLAAYNEWIDRQFDSTLTPTPSLLAYTTAGNKQEIQLYNDSTKSYYNAARDPNNTHKRYGWWLFALHSPDQLRQRTAFALSEIFVISDVDSTVFERSYGASHYYDMLLTKSSSTYSDLLRSVSIHPMMGQYLSHLRNQKATFGTGGIPLTSPDENYAREIMQLFSIGLVQLHPDGSLKLGGDGLPIPTYTQNDITEMARVFTGWSFSKRNSPSNTDTVIDNTTFSYGSGTERYEAQWTSPLKMFPTYHDTGAKSAIGLNIPANQTGEQDLDSVINHLATHPNTAPFICRRLIQRFTSANPSSGYLYRVSNAFRNSNGNFPATMKAILLDPEARTLSSAYSLTSSGKTREPILRATAFLRAFKAKSQMPLADLSNYGYPSSELEKFPANTMVVRMGTTNTSLSQTPQSAPSVFNWFLPDFTPPGLLAANGLNSPELQLANENSVIQATNFQYNPIYRTQGVDCSTLITQSDTPPSHPPNAEDMLIDLSPLEALYMSVVDVNQDGQFTSLDTGAFNNTTAITNACAKVLDHVDLMLCAGGLKARYGDTAEKPRKLILDAAVAVRAANNSSNNAGNQTTYMRDRIKTILWLVQSSPECVIQK